MNSLPILDSSDIGKATMTDATVPTIMIKNAAGLTSDDNAAPFNTIPPNTATKPNTRPIIVEFFIIHPVQYVFDISLLLLLSTFRGAEVRVKWNDLKTNTLKITEMR
ncbi:hypothetical protein D3C80_1815810 [compost metagenome]